MTQKTNSIKRAWRSNSGRRAAWTIITLSFAVMVVLGSFVRTQEEDIRTSTLIQTAKSLAQTALSGGVDQADDILLKVNDLISLDTVLGLRLLQGQDTPLSVGESDADFIILSANTPIQTRWDEQKTTLDIGLRLHANLPYSHLILRLDAENQMPQPLIGTFINWVVAPIIAGLNGILCLWIFGRFFLRPLAGVQTYFEESNGKYALAPLPQDLLKRDDESGAITRHIEAMRTEVNEAKAKIEFQALFLHETPFPLLRCSINRKVLYANVAAKAENALFGDETKEFVSPALSEIVRKAFHEGAQVHGDVRCGTIICTFRAIPVLDQGYVNLYAENIQDQTPI